MIAFVPNGLTMLRIVLVPLIVVLLLKSPPAFIPAFVCFVVASLSDLLDGFLARLWHTESALGATLDPLADKLLLTAVFISFGLISMVPAWVCGVVICRDLSILGGVLFLRWAGKTLTIQPLWISKVNTAFQMALISSGLAMGACGLPFEAFQSSPFFQMLLGATLLTTVFSGAAYAYKGWHLWHIQKNT